MRYYKFNNDLADFSDNHVAASYIGSSLEYTENRFMETGNAIKFSGDDGISTNLTSLKGDFTVSFWFKADTRLHSGKYPLVTKHTNPARGDAGLEFGIFLSIVTNTRANLIFQMGSGNDSNGYWQMDLI